MENFINLEKLMNTHPDNLGMSELLYLKNPYNKEFLQDYMEKWKEIVESRRKTK